MKKLFWMQPGKLDSISGGYIYNKNIIEGFRKQNIHLELFSPGTDFPFPSKKSVQKCRDFLQNKEHSSIVIIDSLILGTIPGLIEEFSLKLVIVGLIHLPLRLNPSLNNVQKKIVQESEIKSFTFSEILIVTSEFSKSEVVKMGINNEKIHVITPGIDTILNPREYSDKPENLLCVSRISESKGQLDLVKALEKLQQFDWKLTFCGGFDEHVEYFKKIRKRISSSGMQDRITFTDEITRTKIERFYKEADLLILPSYFETYSMVLQEAMAFKIPVIAANSGAVTQTANFRIARFYSPGEITQLEKHLSVLFYKDNEYKTLANGYEQLDLKFESWSKKAEQFSRITKKYDGV